MARFPHGGEILGAAPANPLLAPVLRPGRDLNRQQALLDLQAIQRIPGLAGYWPADPAYLYENSVGTIPASLNGVVGCVRNVLAAPVYTPVTVANQGFDADTDWTKGTGWTIADGVATKAAGTSSVLSQAVSLVANVAYVLTWTMTRTAGTLTPRFTGGTTNTGTGMALSGTYEENFVATTGNATLEFATDAAFIGTIDNVTLVSVSNAPALQATTAAKPYLRRTPTSGVYWLDSNIATSALTANLGNLGSACTVVQAGAEGVTFAEGVTISSTYNIAPAFGFNGDIAIFSRALTATEKAMLTRYMQRGVPILSASLVANTGFDADSAWTKGTGWTIADGVATTFFASGGESYNLSQALPTFTTRKYLLGRFTVTAASAGYVRMITSQMTALDIRSAPGTYTNILPADSGSALSIRSGGVTQNVSVDNVSFREIL